MNNQNEFFNKNIVITGVSSGIGLSTTFIFLNCNEKWKKFVKKMIFKMPQ